MSFTQSLESGWDPPQVSKERMNLGVRTTHTHKEPTSTGSTKSDTRVEGKSKGWVERKPTPDTIVNRLGRPHDCKRGQGLTRQEVQFLWGERVL